MDAQALKIVALLVLIGVIVGFSYLPSRRKVKAAVTAPPDSVAATAYQLSGSPASVAG